MTGYVLSPEARDDLRDIRDYLVSQGGRRLARYVLQDITEGFRLLASRPGVGHLRQDLTPLPVKFWPVFSYLIVYDPAAQPIALRERTVNAAAGRENTRDGKGQERVKVLCVG